VIYYFNPLLTIDQQVLEVPPEIFKPIVNLSNEIILESLPVGLDQMGLAQSVNQGLREFIGPYSQEISIGLAIALFFVFRLIGMILRIISFILARIIFYILFICKIIKISSEMKPSEIIRF